MANIRSSKPDDEPHEIFLRLGPGFPLATGATPQSGHILVSHHWLIHPFPFIDLTQIAISRRNALVGAYLVVRATDKRPMGKIAARKARGKPFHANWPRFPAGQGSVEAQNVGNSA